MDVVGSAGAIAARQALALQSEANRVGNAGQRSANADFARSLRDSGVNAVAAGGTDRTVAQTAQRAARVVAASDVQDPNRPLPRGSLVNILV